MYAPASASIARERSTGVAWACGRDARGGGEDVAECRQDLGGRIHGGMLNVALTVQGVQRGTGRIKQQFNAAGGISWHPQGMTMAMQRLILLAAAALLGGCATGYTYHQDGGGDYYSGEPYTDYHYVPSAGFGYGYPGAYYGPYSGWGGGISYCGRLPGLLRRLLRWPLRWVLRRRLSRPVQAAPSASPAAAAEQRWRWRRHRPGTVARPPAGRTLRPARRQPAGDAARATVPKSSTAACRPRRFRDPCRCARARRRKSFGRRRKSCARRRRRVRTPSTSRPSTTSSERHERAVDRGRMKSGSGDTP